MQRRDETTHGDEPVDDTIPVFTQAEVFMLAGYLAELWGVSEDIVDDTEEAVRAVLSKATAE